MGLKWSGYSCKDHISGGKHMPECLCNVQLLLWSWNLITETKTPPPSPSPPPTPGHTCTDDIDSAMTNQLILAAVFLFFYTPGEIPIFILYRNPHVYVDIQAAFNFICGHFFNILCVLFDIKFQHHLNYHMIFYNCWNILIIFSLFSW